MTHISHRYLYSSRNYNSRAFLFPYYCQFKNLSTFSIEKMVHFTQSIKISYGRPSNQWIPVGNNCKLIPGF